MYIPPKTKKIPDQTPEFSYAWAAEAWPSSFQAQEPNI